MGQHLYIIIFDNVVSEPTCVHLYHYSYSYVIVLYHFINIQLMYNDMINIISIIGQGYSFSSYYAIIINFYIQLTFKYHNNQQYYTAYEIQIFLFKSSAFLVNISLKFVKAPTHVQFLKLHFNPMKRESPLHLRKKRVGYALYFHLFLSFKRKGEHKHVFQDPVPTQE